VSLLTKEETIDRAIRLNNYWILDRRKTSSSDEVVAAVSDIVNEMKFRIDIPKKGKNLDKLINHVRVIIMNLYNVYTADPERLVAYSRRSGAYKKTKGYKGFQFGYRNIIRVTEFLRKYGYIEYDKGFPASEEYTQAQLSKMRATKKLISLIEDENKVTPDMVEVETKHDEIIVVKGVKPKKKVRIKIEDGKEKRVTYQPPRKVCKTPDTPAVRQMRNNLKFINYVMEGSDITLDLSRQELRELNARLNQDRDPYKQAVDFSRKSLHRIFLDRRLDRGGRSYGPWYQNIYKEYRPKIMINGAPVVEVDYSGYHPRILYALKGLSLPEDPYTLDDYPNSKEMRDFLKAFFLIMINSKTPKDAMDGIIGENHKRIKRGEETIKPPEIKSFKYADLQPVLDKLIEKHKPIDEYLPSSDRDDSNWGSILQWIDSNIAEYVMGQFALQGYPCLPVHDSFIVDFRLEDELKEMMEKVFTHNFEKDISVKDTWDQLIRIWSPEKMEQDLLPKIRNGLENGTIDRDEFEKGVMEATKRLKESMRMIERYKERRMKN